MGVGDMARGTLGPFGHRPLGGLAIANDSRPPRRSTPSGRCLHLSDALTSRPGAATLLSEYV